MLHHVDAVVRGTRRALVVADMPFLSYATPDEALANAGRFLREAGAQAVKVEGGVRSARIIEAHRPGRHPGHGPHRSGRRRHNTVGKVRVQGKTARSGPRPARRRPRGPGGRRLLDRARARARAAGGGHHRPAPHPDDRHRSRAPAAAARSRSSTDLLGWTDWTPKHAAPLCRPARDHSRRGRAAYAVDVVAGTFPGRADRAHGRRGARRGARPLGRRPGGATPTCRPASRSIATSRPFAAPPPDPQRRPHPGRAALGARDAPRPVGLVPTMGWLHEGHRSLMARPARRAPRRRDDLRQPAPVQRRRGLHALPTQRGAGPGDLRGGGRRPRVRPGVEEVYPPGLRHGRPRRRRRRSARGRGAARPLRRRRDGRGVLFNLVRAERAYFGQKDAQQVRSSGGWRSTSRIPTEVVACPTVREPDGLALSSRNAHLSPRTGRGRGHPPSPCARRPPLGTRRAVGRGAAGRDADVLATEPLADARLRLGRRPGDAARARRGRGGRRCSRWPSRFGSTRLIDNERVG